MRIFYNFVTNYVYTGNIRASASGFIRDKFFGMIYNIVNCPVVNVVNSVNTVSHLRVVDFHLKQAKGYINTVSHLKVMDFRPKQAKGFYI